jgi:hypothetical protein
LDYFLLGAATANAATWLSYTVTNSGTISRLTTGSTTETGMAELDVSGLLIVNLSSLTKRWLAGFMS